MQTTVLLLLCYVLSYQYPFWVTGPSLFDLKLFGFSNHKEDTAEVAKEFHRYGHRQTWVFGGSSRNSFLWNGQGILISVI